jgi:hypothetical protein
MVMRISADAEIAKSMTLDEGPRRIASNHCEAAKAATLKEFGETSMKLSTCAAVAVLLFPPTRACR